MRVLLILLAAGGLIAADGPSPKAVGGDSAGAGGSPTVAPPTQTTPATSAGGTGALRHGPGLRLDGGGRESLLERQRRLDGELAAMRVALAEREREAAEARRAAEVADGRSDSLASKVEILEHARTSLEDARQEVADRGKRIDQLADQLAQSELARLKAEQFAYELAADLLKLEPADGQALTDLQLRVRARLDNVTTGVRPGEKK